MPSCSSLLPAPSHWKPLQLYPAAHTGSRSGLICPEMICPESSTVPIPPFPLPVSWSSSLDRPRNFIVSVPSIKCPLFPKHFQAPHSGKHELLLHPSLGVSPSYSLTSFSGAAHRGKRWLSEPVLGVSWLLGPAPALQPTLQRSLYLRG